MIFDEGQSQTFEISRSKLEDSGKYAVTARNQFGSVTCHFNLIVDKGIRSYIAPEIISSHENNLRFFEGEEIKLAAQVEAYPAINVAWMKDNVRIRLDRRMNTILTNDGTAELVISNATATDAGAYKCIATNAVGRCECLFDVQIDGLSTDRNSILPQIKFDASSSKEPRFIKRPRLHESVEEDSLLIDCHVTGDPTPDIIWCRGLPKVRNFSCEYINLQISF